MNWRAYLFLVLVAGSGSAQQTPTIKTTVPLVVVPVSVTDAKGHFVPGLDESQFVLLDDGRPRPVRVDEPDAVSAPFNLVVLIQTSDISQSALLKIRKVGTMIQDAVVGANGAAAVITFSDEVKVVQDFTSDADELAHTFRDLAPKETRAGKLVDAIDQGMSLLETRPSGSRSAMLIIGESKDRGSETKLQDVMPPIQKLGVTVYSLAYSAYLTPFTTKGSEYKPPEGGNGWLLDAITEAVHASKQDTCKILTEASGGRTLKFETQSKLENDLIRLGTEIHSRYLLSFTPGEDASAGFHKITVQIRDHPELHVNARPGYWSR